MLRSLHIVNYALIEDVEIEFGPGLNIITGETGAGKSILIDAFGLLLGARSNPDLLRTGADRCYVEGIFEISAGHPSLSMLSDMGIEVVEGELVLRREISAEGRGRSFANGVSVPVSALKNVGKRLVDLHGQHDQQSLLDTDLHLDFLDGFDGLTELAAHAGKVYRSLVESERSLEGLRSRAQDLKERREFHSYQAQEIRAVAPQLGEDDRLERERAVLENSERLTEGVSNLADLLYQGEDSVVDRLGSAVNLAENASGIDPSLASRIDEIRSILYGIQELGRFFVSYGQNIEENPDRLIEVQDRIAALSGIKKKFGGTLEEVITRLKSLEQELAFSDRMDEDLASAEETTEQMRSKYSTLCASLSKRRFPAAGRLAEAIQEALSHLGMNPAVFQVDLSRKESPSGSAEIDGVRYEAGPRGIDTAEFKLSTNPGEEVRPLVKVASGGEISRIMLALKSVLSGADSVQILIFDEIDIGISGRIAEVVGRKLKNLSKRYQTISITHLPQIAKMADRHFSVSKGTRHTRTVTRVRLLEAAERAPELAKLIGGARISKLTLQHAEEMLKSS